MNIITLGVGPAATLTGLMLTGLVSAAEAAPPPDCTSVIAYDFTTASAPFYPVANQPAYWRDPAWAPPSAFDPVEAGFPNLTIARNAEIAGGELQYINTPNLQYAAAVFGDIDANATDYLDLFDTYGGTRTIHVEVGVDFHAALYAADAVPIANILTVYALNSNNRSFRLDAEDADGAPSGTIVLRLHWCIGAGAHTSVVVATKARAWADGVHEIRVEMRPSTPLVPGSTINHTLNSDGVARVYIDGVLEYEDTSIQFRPVVAYRAQINDAFVVSAVGMGGEGFGSGWVGGYTYLEFGYCDDVDPNDPPESPTPGGQAPEGEEPAESELPLGITRVMVVLTYGNGSPQSKIKITETPFFIDPPEWHGGYGHPWLISIGEYGRELSDTLRGTDVTVRVGDPERFFRTLAATETIAGATMEIFLVSDTVRYALGEPHRRFAGAVHNVRALPGMEFEFTIRDVQSEEMGRLADFPLLPPAKITPEVFPGATKDYQNRAIPIALGEVSDETETTPQGVVPPLIVAPSMNLTTFGGINVQVVGTILSHGALAPNGLWQGYYNPVDNPYVRIPIPASAQGTIVTWPGAAGWNYVGVDPDLFIDFPLSDPTKTHRYTPVFFLASDPNVQAFLDGRIQIAFNVYGLTDEPDGSGLYFADAPDIYEFLIRNYLYQPHWRYGPYNAMPTFPGGYSFIDHASVVRARERLRAFSGASPARYPVGRLLGANGQQESLKAVLNSLCIDVLMDHGRDRHGRILLDVEDVDAVATHALSDLLDIEDGEFEVWIDRSAYYNHCEYYFGERYLPAVAPLPTPPEGETLPPVNLGAHDKWQSIGTYTHAEAVAANRGRQTPALQLENRWVRDSDVAVSVVERTIARAVGPGPMRDGQRLFRLRTSWQALAVELGDVIAIDHIEGLGASGFEGQRARVLKISEDLQSARITLEGRLLYSEGSPS
jgi:hypothetical protein